MREMREEKVGIVKAVCISEKKGTQKKNVGKARFIEDFGLENDAHAGNWHRQVSLLSYEVIEQFKAKGAPVEDGAFGENLIVTGFDFKNYPVGTRFACNSVILEMTQIGKTCHKGCEIQKEFSRGFCAQGKSLWGTRCGGFCDCPENSFQNR